jgi:hypothetical protein
MASDDTVVADNSDQTGSTADPGIGDPRITSELHHIVKRAFNAESSALVFLHRESDPMRSDGHGTPTVLINSVSDVHAQAFNLGENATCFCLLHAVWARAPSRYQVLLESLCTCQALTLRSVQDIAKVEDHILRL